MPAIRVRVVGDPGGDHPEWVRQAWLGVEFDAFPQGEEVQATNEISRETVMMDRPWAVRSTVAFKALEDAGRTEAADWWRLRGYPGYRKEWLFEFSSCVAVAELETAAAPPPVH